MQRDEAIAIMHDFVKNQNLRRHMLAVEAVMRDYAKFYGEDPDEWLYDSNRDYLDQLEAYKRKRRDLRNGE